MTIILAVICVAIWAYLLAARGQFWRGAVQDAAAPPRPQHWPSVAVVVPARNEAECIAESVQSLLRQNYRRLVPHHRRRRRQRRRHRERLRARRRQIPAAT